MTRPAVGFLGTGAYLPERSVSNEDIVAKVPDATSEWIVRKTAIRSRRFAADHEATSDLAAKAVLEALDQAGLPAGSVDYLIVATSTGDFPQPPTACIVQQLTGTTSAACFDINVVCAGFVYGVELARSLVSAHPGAHAVVVAADVYSRILDFDDRRTAILLGDGAGAAVIGQVAEGYGIIDVELGTRGDAEHLIKVPAGGSRTPTSARTIADGGHFGELRVQVGPLLVGQRDDLGALDALNLTDHAVFLVDDIVTILDETLESLPGGIALADDDFQLLFQAFQLLP